MYNGKKVGNIINFHLFAVLFSIIITIFLLIVADVGSQPKLFEINYSQFGSILNWLIIFILIFLILNSLYFIRSLSEMLFAFFNLKYFWLYELVASLVVTNIIYISNHSFSIPVIEIIQVIQIFSLTLLDLYAIGFLIIASGIRSTDLKLFFEKICENEIIGFILGPIRLITDDPIFAIIVLASTKILEFNFNSLNEIVLSVLIVIVLSLNIQKLLVLILPVMGIPYQPSGISVKLNDIIYNLIFIPVTWLLNKLWILLKPLLSKPILSVVSLIQPINFFLTITDHTISNDTKILRLIVSTLVLLICVYFIEPKKRLNILESFLSLTILSSVISLVYFLAGPIQDIDNQTLLLYVLAILLIFLLCSLAQSPFKIVVKCNDPDKILIRTSIVKKGWKYMSETKDEKQENLYGITIEWSVVRKNYVMFVFDSSAGMVSIHDKKRSEKESLSLKLADKILKSLNFMTGMDRFGFSCWTENEVDNSYRDGLSGKEPDELKTEMENILAETAKNGSAGKNITNALMDTSRKIEKLRKLNPNENCSYSIIFITDLFFQTDNIPEIYSEKIINNELEDKKNSLYAVVVGGDAKTDILDSMKKLPNTTCIEIKDEDAISENQDFTGLLSLFSTQFGLNVALPEGMEPDGMDLESRNKDRFEKIANGWKASWSSQELTGKRSISFDAKWNAKQGSNKKPEITLELLFNGTSVNRSISHELHNNVTNGDGRTIKIDQTMKVQQPT